jgi:hypothetical protein
MDRFKDARETVVMLAKESFAKHVVAEVGTNEWRCSAPGTWMHGFYVIARPGYVMVYGDIGDWILQHSDRDSVAWLRGAARDYDYLCGKIRTGEKRRFYGGDALDDLNREIAEADEQNDTAARVREALGNDFDQHEWYQAWSDVGIGGSDCGSFEHWDSGPLWMAEALRWLVEHLPAAQPQPSQPSPPSTREGG